MTLRRGEGEYYQGFFNELKQEFVSSRYLLFEAVTATAPHFSDRNVIIADTLDCSIYSLSSQKLRLAFRSTSSLFDKTAVFLNHYLNLQIPEKQVTFRKIWYSKQDRERGIREEFSARNNPWLRALFAVSLDIFENADGFAEISEPNAHALYEIRNFAEHKFLKLHSSEALVSYTGTGSFQDSPRPLSLTRHEFEEKTRGIMRTAREMLIYLSLLIRAEERGRAEEEQSVCVPVPWIEFAHNRRM